MEILVANSSGKAVEALQERLKEFGFYAGDITGQFDNTTLDAVIDFQKADGLATDGIVGLMTLQSLGLLTLPTSDL